MVASFKRHGGDVSASGFKNFIASSSQQEVVGKMLHGLDPACSCRAVVVYGIDQSGSKTVGYDIWALLLGLLCIF